MSYDPQSGGNTEPTGETGGTGGTGGTPPAGGQPTQPTGGYMPPAEGGYTLPPPPTQGGGYTPPPGGGYSPPPPPPTPPGGGYGAPPPPPGPERPMGGPTVNMGNMGSMNQAGMQDLFQSYMNAVTKPSVATYEAEIPKASWMKVLVGVTIVAVISFIVNLIFAGAAASQLGALRSQFANSNINFDPTMFAGGVGVGGAVLGFFLTYVAFFCGAGILWLSARLLGGTGSDFMTHSYLLSISYTPLRVIGNIAGIIPILGGIVQFVAVLYQLYCAGLALQASQRMQPGRAQLAAFLPLIIGIVLGCGCIILFTVVLVGALNGTTR